MRSASFRARYPTPGTRKSGRALPLDEAQPTQPKTRKNRGGGCAGYHVRLIRSIFHAQTVR